MKSTSRLTLEFLRGWLYIGLVLATLALLLWWPQVQDWLGNRDLLPESTVNNGSETAEQQPIPPADQPSANQEQIARSDADDTKRTNDQEVAEITPPSSEQTQDTAKPVHPASTKATQNTDADNGSDNTRIANPENTIAHTTNEVASTPPSDNTATNTTDKANVSSTEQQAETAPAIDPQSQTSQDLQTDSTPSETLKPETAARQDATQTAPKTGGNTTTIQPTAAASATDQPTESPQRKTSPTGVAALAQPSQNTAEADPTSNPPMATALAQAAHQIPRALLADQALRAQAHPERPYTWVLSAQSPFQIHTLTSGTIVANYENPFEGRAIYLFDETRGLLFLYSQLGATEPLEKGQGVDAFTALGSPTTADNRYHFHLTIHRIDAEQEWWQGTAIDPAEILTH